MGIKAPEYFWSHVAEYPSHHAELPPGTEAAFVGALTNGTPSFLDKFIKISRT